MMIAKTLVVLAALEVAVGFSSSVWSNAFVAPSSYRVRSSPISMVAVIDGKQRQLDMGKEKYAGRSDLVSMIDVEDDEVDAYNLFAEADNDQESPPKTGQTITGTVIEMDDNGALLEIGGKMSGYLPLKEAALIPIKHVNTVLEIGQELTAEVIGTLKGMPVISLRTAQLIVAWEQALQMRASDATFEAKVIEVNRGGVVVDAGGLKCFLPGSHYMGTPDESIIGNVVKVTSISCLFLRCLLSVKSSTQNVFRFKSNSQTIFTVSEAHIKYHSCASVPTVNFSCHTLSPLQFYVFSVLPLYITSSCFLFPYFGLVAFLSSVLYLLIPFFSS